MPQWLWQCPDWPQFYWNESSLVPILSKVRFCQGQLLGTLKHLDKPTQVQLESEILTNELTTSSAIEGEILNRDSVRSSIAHRLGLAYNGQLKAKDYYVEGCLDLALDATQNYHEPLTEARLINWQGALFPTGRSGLKRILVGEYRQEGEMQIISGRMDKPRLHYIAPPYDTLPKHMADYLSWFERTNPKTAMSTTIDGLIRAGLAHLWFELIHPFDDGNGRVGRAIIDLALAQDEQLSTRYYSVSQSILAKRTQYYQALETICSQNSLDITSWLQWFLACIYEAITTSQQMIKNILLKSHFWQMHHTQPLTERQRKVLNRMLDEGPAGFVGGMTTRKYCHLTKVSRATAYRELSELVNLGCLEAIPNLGGRSSAYQIVWPE